MTSRSTSAFRRAPSAVLAARACASLTPFGCTRGRAASGSFTARAAPRRTLLHFSPARWPRPKPPLSPPSKDCPRLSQDAPPRRHQENTRRTRGGTRRLEDGPRLPRVSRRLPKDCPKTAQDSSRAPQDLLQDGPRWPLRGPEATRGAPESVPRSPQLSWGVRGCIGTSIIVLMFVAAPSASTSSSSPTSPSS